MCPLGIRLAIPNYNPVTSLKKPVDGLGLDPPVQSEFGDKIAAESELAIGLAGAEWLNR